MNPEYGTSTRDLHVSVREVERIMTSSRLRLRGVFDLLTKLGWGQVRHGGNG